MIQIKKYPRTQHIEGSRLQFGDEDLDSVPFKNIKGKHLIVEEKMDGANSAISFSEQGNLRLQSRGHYLTGGPREKHFNLFKTWANTHLSALYQVLGKRYIMYGEWLYAKHTVFYTDLPHYFMEFDIFDTEEEYFLSLKERQVLLDALPFIQTVKVLHEGPLDTLQQLTNFVGQSYFINEQAISVLRKEAEDRNLDANQVIFETDNSNLMEGLYIKIESEREVLERYKWVRADFLSTVQNSNSHWLNRPIIPNKLAEGVDLFS